MTVIEFMNAHREDEDGCECIIFPDGTIGEPVPSHINCLLEIAGADSAFLHSQMEKSMEPLFWLVEYTGCLSVWQTRVVAPSVMTGEQTAALEELCDAALVSPKYVFEQADSVYAQSVKKAKLAVKHGGD